MVLYTYCLLYTSTAHLQGLVKAKYGQTLTDFSRLEMCIRDRIKAIRPADIIRIEYHDNPGLRYGNAEVVLDYIRCV